MQFWLYRISLYIFRTGHWIYSQFNNEARSIHRLKTSISQEVIKWRENNAPKKLVIIHCASLGEFEMSIPIYHSLKEKLNCVFIFSFFSASGYEHAVIPSSAQKVYLPFDVNENVGYFLKTLNPDLFIFIKYEYWFTLLNQLKQLKIPYGFVNVIDQSVPPIFKWKFVKDFVSKSEFFCATNEKSKEIYHQILDLDVKVFEDLRYVKGIIDQKENTYEKYSFIQASNYKSVVVCGSIYHSDFDLIEASINLFPETLWILAPHHINTDFDERIISSAKSMRISDLLKEECTDLNTSVILVDTIGDLKYLYSFGTIAYIGGGFEKGIHNIIEPISFGLNVIVGPNINSFPEALKLLKKGKILLAKDVETFLKHLRKHHKDLDTVDIHSEAIETKEFLNNLEQLTDYIIRNEN